MALLEKAQDPREERHAASGRLPSWWSPSAASSRSPRSSTSRTPSRRSKACGPTRRWSWRAATSTSAKAAISCHSQMIRPFPRRGGAVRATIAWRPSRCTITPFQWGLQAHRSGSGTRRRTLLQRMACPAPDRPALGGAGIQHAGIWLPGADAAAAWMTPDGHLPEPTGAVGVPYDDEMIGNAHARSSGAGQSPMRIRQVLEAPLSQMSASVSLRRRSLARDGDGCARRLSPDARHAGRLSPPMTKPSDSAEESPDGL